MTVPATLAAATLPYAPAAVAATLAGAAGGGALLDELTERYDTVGIEPFPFPASLLPHAVSRLPLATVGMLAACCTSADTLRVVADDPRAAVGDALASNPALPDDVAARLAADAAGNPRRRARLRTLVERCAERGRLDVLLDGPLFADLAGEPDRWWAAQLAGLPAQQLVGVLSGPLRRRAVGLLGRLLPQLSRLDGSTLLTLLADVASDVELPADLEVGLAEPAVLRRLIAAAGSDRVGVAEVGFAVSHTAVPQLTARMLHRLSEPGVVRVAWAELTQRRRFTVALDDVTLELLAGRCRRTGRKVPLDPALLDAAVDVYDEDRARSWSQPDLDVSKGVAGLLRAVFTLEAASLPKLTAHLRTRRSRREYVDVLVLLGATDPALVRTVRSGPRFDDRWVALTGLTFESASEPPAELAKVLERFVSQSAADPEQVAALTAPLLTSQRVTVGQLGVGTLVALLSLERPARLPAGTFTTLTGPARTAVAAAAAAGFDLADRCPAVAVAAADLGFDELVGAAPDPSTVPWLLYEQWLSMSPRRTQDVDLLRRMFSDGSRTGLLSAHRHDLTVHVTAVLAASAPLPRWAAELLDTAPVSWWEPGRPLTAALTRLAGDDADLWATVLQLLPGWDGTLTGLVAAARSL